MKKHITVEVCCGSVDDCLLAEKLGADRIELNHALELGGLTPSLGTFLEAKRQVSLPICVMIRPRGAGFDYTERQFQAMLKDAELFIEHGADGLVFGFLNEDGSINEERTCQMVKAARGKEATFHKAYDSTKNMEDSLKTLIRCGITRVLTSGGAVYPNIVEGCKELGRLQDLYGDQIQILPGGGVREHNARQVLKLAHTGQIHLTAKNTLIDESTGHYHTAGNRSGLEYLAVGEMNLKKIMEQIRGFDDDDPDTLVTLFPG